MDDGLHLDIDDQASRHGDVTATGNSRLHLGDNYYYQIPVPTELDLNEWRGHIFDALSYNDMNGKSQQLESIDAPTASFDWVGNTSIPEWFETGSGIFWISGKPGSGKSVLMKHLVSSHSTKQRLNRWKEGCMILEFFFDYRAAGKEANDISGMLKLFLYQLSSQSDIATKCFHQFNASKTELRDANVAKLSTILSATVQRCDLPICAFIDGLDEYEGDWVDLIDILQRLEDRTGMKIFLASRPEPQLKDLLSKYRTVTLQDHNVASLRVYIERALIRARRSDPDIGAKFTEQLQDEIALKARGIILWARLAVDELIRACVSGRSANQLRQILDTLPTEVEEMYERILSKLHHGFATESATLLLIITTWHGQISLTNLLGLWDLFVEDCSIHVVGFSDMSELKFRARIDHMLGTLVDLLPGNDVRLLHRTFSNYLDTTSWVAQNLPQMFAQNFPDSKLERISAYVVSRATRDLEVSQAKLSDRLASPDARPHSIDYEMKVVLQEVCDLDKIVHWSRRVSILAECVVKMPSIFRAMRHVTHHFPMLWSALKFPVMLLYCRGYSEDRYEKKLPAALLSQIHESVLDLVLAIMFDYSDYAKWRLQWQSEPFPADSVHTQALFDISIYSMLDNAPMCTAAEMVAEAMSHRGACRTRYQPCLLMSRWGWWHLDTLYSIQEILSKCAQDLDTERHFKDCPDHCSDRSPLIEWLQTSMRTGYLRPVFATMLKLICNSGEEINESCYHRGTVLHAAVDPLPHNANSVLWKELYPKSEVVKLLLHAGADPTVKHLDALPYDYAVELEPLLKEPKNHSVPLIMRLWQGIEWLFGKYAYGWGLTTHTNGLRQLRQIPDFEYLVSSGELVSILELLKPQG